MTPELLQWICCPSCKGDFALSADDVSDHGVEEGALTCAACSTSYPITRGVPRFVQGDGYVQSFSYEWNRSIASSSIRRTAGRVGRHLHREDRLHRAD